jgi:chemotaxis signal transduction protein/chemotaxis methyl-accepting protein methylase
MDFKFLMEHQKTLNKNLKSKRDEQVFEYDYKIVSFKIGHEHYGIDIMCVKEILKEKKFTRIPNSLDFVEGVLNLRGEILPVIDLARMFHLKEEDDAPDSIKSIIIIKVDGLLIGLIVDKINHVIPLRKMEMQPPSPLLGKMNDRYIEGVIEINEKLYVILDTDAVFSDKGKSRKDVLPQDSDLSEDFFNHFIHQIEEFSTIHVHSYNKHRFRQLYEEYAAKNNVTGMPTINKQTANEIVFNFFSLHTGSLWQKPYVDGFISTAVSELKKYCSEEVRVLNLGCGHGHEAFSIYILLNESFPDADIKMVAADINLVSISNASGFETQSDQIPSWINRDNYFMNVSGNKFKIKQEINNKIYFEFHNVQNISTFNKQFDLIVARDLSLYLSEENYRNFISGSLEKLATGGVIVVGDNEIIHNAPQFLRIGTSSAYRKIEDSA